jgi:hypothetical protein
MEVTGAGETWAAGNISRKNAQGNIGLVQEPGWLSASLRVVSLPVFQKTRSFDKIPIFYSQRDLLPKSLLARRSLGAGSFIVF